MMLGSRHFSEKPNRGRRDQPQSPVDVVILTAVKAELDAVIALANDWQELRDLGGFRYFRREIQRSADSIVVAAAWIGEMGERSTAIRAMQLLDELSPSCLAMCGICAGDRSKVALGDIIVANQLFAWDEGKRVQEPGKSEEFFHNLRAFKLEATWGMDAAFLASEFANSVLQAKPPLARYRQVRWILHTLYKHETQRTPAPMQHPDRTVACPDWTDSLRQAQKQEWIVRKGASLVLTDAGRDQVEADLVDYPDGLPPLAPVRVHVGAMATVSAVTEDPTIFKRMQHVVRGTIGLEMEGAALGEVAERFNKRAILVKAVQDFADGTKNDEYRAFGCRAAAEFLLAFLEKHFEPEHDREDDNPTRRDARDFDFDRGHEHPFLTKVERAAQARFPTAKITKHRVDSPLVGLLELETHDGGLSESRLVGILDAPITPDVVVYFATSVEKPFRTRFPHLRSTLVHTGHAASPELRNDAFRNKGIQLETFDAYQGLFDLEPYLQWQTNRLRRTEVYPPSLYVDAPAKYQVRGNLDWTFVDNALQYLWDLLNSSELRRFALVLGDFGFGKTFLLRELARRMHEENHGVWPVLLEMRWLEKRHDLPELLAAHFAKADVVGYNFRAFQYMLNEGRIALLFDGFDELADRVTYDTTTEHFRTVLSATQGERAKVILSSRRQHFLSESQVKSALTEQAQHISGFRVVMLEPFGEAQIRHYLRKTLGDENAANERYALIDEIKDLLGLSKNPRMLGFITKIPEAKLHEAKARKQGHITSADLYALLVAQWLEGEHDRLKDRSTQKCFSLKALEKGVKVLALSMWHMGVKDVAVDDIRDVLVEALRDLNEPALDPNMIAFLFASGSLLVRDAEGRFSFVHRSVLEWLVAREAAEELVEAKPCATLEANDMSALMADFVIDMAGRAPAERWAHAVLDRHAEARVKNNAAVVLVRIDKRWPRVVQKADAPVVLNFAGQDLRGQDFSGVNWRGADLRGANLEGATLVGANLEGANLEGAKLYRANLTNAKLAKANWTKVDLRVARLMNADLTGAEGLESVTLFRTNFAGAKLPGGFDPVKLDSYGIGPVLGQSVPMWAGVATACYCVAWDPRGELLVAGFADGTVRIFDAVSGDVLRVLAGHTSAVNSVAFSNDGNIIASGSDDKTLRLWDLNSGHFLRSFAGHLGSVLGVAISPNGNTIASGSHDKTVRLWDVNEGRCLRSLEGHQDSIRSVAFSTDGNTIASGSDDNAVRLWDATSGQLLRSLEGHISSVWSVAFSPDGNTIASGSSDATVRLWDVTSGRFLQSLDGHHSAIYCVAFSTDGNVIGFGSDDNTVRLYDVTSGRFLRSLDGHNAAIWSVAFSPNGQTICSGSLDNTVRLWDVTSGRLRSLEGHENSVYCAAISPNGKIMISGSKDNILRLWDPNSGRLLGSLDGHKDAVSSVAFSSDGKTMSTGSYDKTARLWDVNSGRFLRALEGHQHAVVSVAFSPDGNIMSTGSDNKTVRLWNVNSGRFLRSLEGHQSAVWSIAFSPDGNTICSGSDDHTVRLWDVNTGRFLRSLEGHKSSVLSVAFSPDGKTVCSGSYDHTMRLWDVDSGQFLLSLGGHKDSVLSVAFSPDGQTICSGSADNTLRLWDANSGRFLRSLEGHQESVSSVAFAPDGQTIASSSFDGTVRLWDVTSGQCYAILFATKDGWVAFTPDGHYKFGGNLGGSFWHVVGLCRFELGEIDAFLPPHQQLRLPDDHRFVLPP